MRPGLKKSFVWEFFSKRDKHVQCNICKKELKFSGNTSNLNDHLRRKHPGHLKDKNGDRTTKEAPTTSVVNVSSAVVLERDTDQVATREICPVSPTPGPSTASPSQKPRRPLQTKLLISDKHSELSETEKRSIDESLIEMLVTDFQPLSIVENKGFLNYSRKMQPLYKVPNRKLLANTMLPEKYKEVAQKVRGMLEKVPYIAVTTDMWTSDSNRAFLTLTSHFLFEKKLRSAVLSTREVPEKHTADNIASVISTIFEEWLITSKVVTIVSDNGANIKKAIENLKKRHHPCVAHTLNLCVTDAIKNVSDITELLAKCRALVSHFKHSVVASEKLKTMQRQMGLSELKVKQDVATRWNSSLIMMKRLFLLKEPLSAVITSLPNAPEFLIASEWDIISDCIDVLEPVESMTIELSGEKYPTMSLIIPLIRGLQHTIKNGNVTTSCGWALRRALLEVITRRLGLLEADKSCAKSTFVDPRFKKLAFGNEQNANNAQKWVSEEVALIIASKNADTQRVSKEAVPPPPQGQQPHQKPKSLWTIFDQKVAEAKTVSVNAPSVIANVTVEQYLRAENIERSQDALEFWQDHRNLFPELFQLSGKYMCIPATSVPSERVFSKAGQIINDRRNHLKGEKLDYIVFLNSNIEL